MVWSSKDGKISECNIKEVVKFVQNNKTIGLDIETDGLEVTCNITAIQVGTDKASYFVDTRDSYLLSVMLQVLSEAIDVLFILVNGKFDCTRLLRNGCRIRKVWDVMVIDIKLHNGIEYEIVNGKYQRRLSSARALIYRHFKVDISKAERLSFKGKQPYRISQVEYGLTDVKYLIPLYNIQYEHSIKVGNSIGVSIENSAVPVFSEMINNGLYLNTVKWVERYEKLNKEFLIRKLKLDDELRRDSRLAFTISNQIDLFNPERRVLVNYNSQDDCIAIFEALGLDLTIVDKKTQTVKKSVEIEVLTKYKGNPVIDAYISMKEFYKDITTYGLNWLEYVNPKTGRIHTDFKQLVSTGRTSSKNPNIQNIPSDVDTRSCFTNQKEGWKILSADYSAQEIVVSADFSGDPEAIKIIENNLDSHCETATAISHIFFGSTVVVTPENKGQIKTADGTLLRYIGKQLNLSISYLVGAKTVSEKLGVAFDVAASMIKAVVKKFKVRHEFFDSKFNEAYTRGYIVLNNLTNSRTYLSNYQNTMDTIKRHGGIYVPRYKKVQYANGINNITERKISGQLGVWRRNAANTPIQGSSAEITKLAMVYIHKELLDKNIIKYIRLVDMIHDELLYEVKEEYVEIATEIIQRNMEKAGSKFLSRLKLKASVDVGYYWVH